MGASDHKGDARMAAGVAVPAGPAGKELLDGAIGLVNSITEGDSKVDIVDALDIISSEDRVYHYVCSGDVDSLLRLHACTACTPPDGISMVTHLKSLMVSLNAICLHAAIRGGVSKRVSYALNQKVSQKIHGCEAEDDLLRLSESRTIPLSYCLLVSGLTRPRITDGDVSKAIRYIQDHHHERLSVGELAEYIGISPGHLTTKFRRETGMTASEYISHVRIREAKSLLRFTSLSVGEVAAQLAFSSQSHFQTAFKRTTGMTPQQYRASSEE